MAEDEDPERRPTPRFATLPEPVDPRDMVEEKDVANPVPVDGGHDAAHEYVIRHLLA